MVIYAWAIERYRPPVAWLDPLPTSPFQVEEFVAGFIDANREPTKVRRRFHLKGGGMKVGVVAVVTGL
jgi:hypothetical protein